MDARYKALKIYVRAYALAKVLLPLTEHYPKPQQYGGLASELREATLALLSAIITANETRTKKDHATIDAHLQRLETMLSLSKDLRYLSPEQHADLVMRLDEIGRMNGGWMKTATD